MRYEINPDRTKLKLIADVDDQAALNEMGDEIHSDVALIDFLDRLCSNSELDWVRPEECGDLTDAPMLGIRDQNGKVLERWAWMDYQVCSLLEALEQRGFAVLVGGS